MTILASVLTLGYAGLFVALMTVCLVITTGFVVAECWKTAGLSDWLEEQCDPSMITDLTTYRNRARR